LNNAANSVILKLEIQSLKLFNNDTRRFHGLLSYINQGLRDEARKQDTTVMINTK
jgi:hypothetical protein